MQGPQEVGEVGGCRVLVVVVKEERKGKKLDSGISFSVSLYLSFPFFPCFFVRGWDERVVDKRWEKEELKRYQGRYSTVCGEKVHQRI